MFINDICPVTLSILLFCMLISASIFTSCVMETAVEEVKFAVTDSVFLCFDRFRSTVVDSNPAKR